jgi:hypothetical protein
LAVAEMVLKFLYPPALAEIFFEKPSTVAAQPLGLHL